ncbi:hypothetical protein Tco_1035616, partial [Tanacetum coccineum]
MLIVQVHVYRGYTDDGRIKFAGSADVQAQLMPFDQNVLPECRDLDGAATKAAENARRRAEAEVQVDVARCQHNARIAQENQMEPWDERSTMNGGSHAQVGSDYPLSLKRESLFLDRLLQHVSRVSSFGLPFYGRAHELPTTRSAALGIDSSSFVTQ